MSPDHPSVCLFTSHAVWCVMVVAVLVGCAYDSDALGAVQCDQEGEVSGERQCQDGYWVYVGSSGELDAGAEVGEPPDASPGTDGGERPDAEPDAVPDVTEDADTGPQLDGCDRPSQAQVCVDADLDCGDHEVQDRCGDMRSVQCGECAGGQRCTDAGRCVAPTCDDGLWNGDETDVDCGGPDCPPCTVGQSCESDSDCTSAVCGVERARRGLVAEYDFSQGTGDVVYDRSPTYVEVANALGAVMVLGQDFDDDQIRDESGNLHHGELMGGAQWQPSGGPTNRLSGYLSHQASASSYTAIGNDPQFQINQQMTIAYWRRHSGEWEEDQGVDISKGNDFFAVKNRVSTPENLEWDLRGGDENIRVETGDGAVTDNQWQFVVLTWDGRQAAIYVDDMTDPKSDRIAVQAPIGTNDHDVILAGHNVSGDEVERFSNLDLTGIAIFDRSLDASQRRALRNGSYALDLDVENDTQNPENGSVEWAADEVEAVDFDGGLLRHDGPDPIYDSVLEGQARFSLEWWGTAQIADQGETAQMVSLSAGPSQRNASMAKQDDALVLQVRNADSDDGAQPAMASEPDMVTSEREHYIWTFDEGVSRLYRNGLLAVSTTTSGDLTSWDRDLPLVVGNDTDFSEPWRGRLFHIAIYDRALSTAEVGNHYAAGNTAESMRCAPVNPYVETAQQWDPVLLFGQRFDGVIRDLSGTDHDGQLEGGAQWITAGGPSDALGAYLHHRSWQDSYTWVDAHSDLDLTGSHTIAYWRRRNATVADYWEAEFAKGNDAYQARTQDLASDRLNYALRSSEENTEAVTEEDTVFDDQWQFVVHVFDIDQEEMAIYVDDMDDAAAELSRSAGIRINEVDLTISAQDSSTASSSGSMRRFAGLDITGFVIFDRALDASQRTALRDAGY